MMNTVNGLEAAISECKIYDITSWLSRQKGFQIDKEIKI